MSYRAYRSIAVLMAAAGTLSGQRVATPPNPPENVPVRQVMLFSSGVGYFEHDGTVRGDASTELHFRTAQINDVLKSLVLQDLDGGKASTVTYPSQDPIDKTLRSFEVDLAGSPSLAALLQQLRGAAVTLESRGETISGTVLGVETRALPTDHGPVNVPILNVVSGASIRAVELEAVSGLTFDDPKLRDEMSRALAALGQARDQDKKPVSISFTGTGQRRVRIGYVVETPVWKTSYRLVLDSKASLQGWAIVENQTESDWNNVTLSLVSGRPISFIENLYQPLYAQRPTVTPNLYSGLTPQVYSPGMISASQLQVPTIGAVGSMVQGKAAGVSLNAVTASAAPDPGSVIQIRSISSPINATASVSSLAATTDLGGLFEFTVSNVTLARQKSAMIPIVTDTVKVERVSIYNPNVLAGNPLTGARLTNSTGKLLLQGPVTVFDHGSYAGDAQIDNVPQGQDRLLSYGVDLDVHVDATRNGGSSTTLTARIVKGTIDVSQRYVLTREYRFDNRGADARTIILEHPIRGLPGSPVAGGVTTPKPYETTPVLDRYRIVAPARTVTAFTVSEEAVTHQLTVLSSANAAPMIEMSKNGAIPQAVRDAITKAAELERTVSDLDRQTADVDTQIREITSEQVRIRDDMNAVDNTAQYYQRLLTKLNDQETQIEKLQSSRADLAVRRAAQSRALTDYLDGLTIG